MLLLFLLLTPALAHSPKTCFHPSPFAPTFTLRNRIPPSSHALALSSLQPPRLIPLLFGSSLIHVEVRPPFVTLFKPRNAHAQLHIISQRDDAIAFNVTAHSSDFFPVPMQAALFLIRVKEKPAEFILTFRGAPLDDAEKQRARNVFARALTKDMMVNARLVLGMYECSGNVMEVSGVCNNVRKPTIGSRDSKQVKKVTVQRLKLDMQLPNPRWISNELCKAKTERKMKGKVNFLMVLFGQFVDHDIVLTPSGERPKDASFDNLNKGKMPFLRSDALSLPKCCRYVAAAGAEPFNRVTSFVDGSAIYGSDYVRNYALREWVGGRMKLKKKLLPRNNENELYYTVENANRRWDGNLFVAGDVRGNENPVLMSLHVLFVREHNRVCAIIRNELRRRRKPVQSDEWIYLQARRVVVAELQCIVFKEWLPILLGEELGRYPGYKSDVDAGIDVLFSSAAFRWGHSAIRRDLVARKKDGRERRYRLENGLFNEVLFKKEGVDEWLRGGMFSEAMEVDLMHEDAVRDFLFTPGKRGVLDLVALNIQRGRDHEVPSYVAARRIYGLSGGLDDIDDEIAEQLVKAYGDAGKIDVFVGGLAERTEKGLLGPLFRRIVKDQFERLRDGDRFYFERIKWGRFMSSLGVVRRIRAKRVRLAHLIVANTKMSVDEVRRGVMHVPKK